ncbi:MAG: hypothetical protein JWM36_2493 [Hyphomicrobiales bacterium]|nr:hypothetical protein [Hyphomicrobiales bacterium]
MDVTGSPAIKGPVDTGQAADTDPAPTTDVMKDPTFLAYFLQSMTLTFIHTTNAAIDILNQAIDEPE